MSLGKTAIVAALALFLFYAVLILSLLTFFEGPRFLEVLLSPDTLFSIRLSLLAATAAMILAVAIGLPAAYALSRFSFPGKKMVDTFLELPMIMSPVALGAALLVFFNTPMGNVIQEKGIFFVFEFPGIVLAQFATIAGLATRLMKTALDEISPAVRSRGPLPGFERLGGFPEGHPAPCLPGNPERHDPLLGQSGGRVRGHGHARRDHGLQDRNHARGHLHEPGLGGHPQDHHPDFDPCRDRTGRPVCGPPGGKEAPGPMIEVRGLNLSLGNFRIENLDLAVKEGAFNVLLGPTGSGKTLILESIVGLRRIHRGMILIGEEEVQHLPPEKRGISYVPQDLALFPHLTVEENLAIRAAGPEKAFPER